MQHDKIVIYRDRTTLIHILHQSKHHITNVRIRHKNTYQNTLRVEN